jgi:hypothetical protein
MANAETPILRRLRRRAEERSRLRQMARARSRVEPAHPIDLASQNAAPSPASALPDRAGDTDPLEVLLVPSPPSPELPPAEPEWPSGAIEVPAARAESEIPASAASSPAPRLGEPLPSAGVMPEAFDLPEGIERNAEPVGTRDHRSTDPPDWLLNARPLPPAPQAAPPPARPVLPETPPAVAVPAATRPRWLSVVRMAGGALAALLLVGALAAGVVVFRLSQGPLSMDIVTERVTSALEAQFGEGFDVSVRHTDLERTSDGILLGVSGIVVRDATGQIVVAAPRAQIGFDATALMSRRPVPKHIEFLGLAVVLTIQPDGSVSVSADAPEGQATSPDAAGGAPTLALGMASFLDVLSSRKGPLAILERAGVRDGRLTINDQRRGLSVTYRNLGLSYTRPQPGENRLKLTALGPKGPWTLAATVAGTRGTERVLSFDVQDLAVSEILGFAQPGSIPVATDMPLSGEARVTLASDNRVIGVEGKITGGSALVKIEDPDARPFAVDHLTGTVGWDESSRAILIRSLDLKAGATQWKLGGTVGLPAEGHEYWAVDLASPGSVLAGEGQDKPIAISDVAVKARVGVGFQSVTIDSVTLKGPEVALAGSGRMGHGADFDGIQLQVTAGRMPARVLLAFWPHFLAADVRDWLIANVQAGTIDGLDYRSSLTPSQLADVFKKLPLPDDGVHTHFTASRGTMTVMDGLPALTDIQLEGTITGRTASLKLPSATAQIGTGKPLVFSDATIRFDDMSRKPPVAQVGFRLQGGAEAFFAGLRSEALRAFVPLSFDPQGIKGQVDAQVKVAVPMTDVIRAQDVSLEAQGGFTGLTVDRLVGKEKLEQASLTFVHDAAGLVLKGDGKLGGMPATIDYRQAAGAPAADAVVSFVADEAARTRRGIKLPGLTGPVSVKITAKEGTPVPAGGKPALPLVEVDLTRAAMTDVIPGFSKPAGKPGKAVFRLDETGQGIGLQDFSLEAAGGLLLKGAINLTSDGNLATASLPVVKIGPGDDMKVEAERAGNVLKLSVRATSVDGRPYIRSLTSPGAGAGAGDVDLDLKSGTVIGFNGENIGGMDMRLVLRSNQIRDLRLTGRLGRAAVNGQGARGESGGPAVILESADAGAFLRFADIYRRMQGGRLLLQLSTAGTLDGVLVVDDFTLVNEPALASATSPPPSPRDSRASPPPANGSVAFSKLRAPFSVSSGVLSLRETTLSGASVGGVVQGTIDFNRDQMDLKGTFVPAYGLNNVFNRVPIVGALLGGGKDEGLFAVNFRVGGSFSQPALSINPLSAVAPGFLRKLFGAPRPEITAPPPAQ